MKFNMLNAKIENWQAPAKPASRNVPSSSNLTHDSHANLFHTIQLEKCTFILN